MSFSVSAWQIHHAHSIHDIPNSSNVQGGRVDDLDARPCGLTSRDPSPVDKVPVQAKKRDIYPITWRVVGGGVMMSGNSMCFPVAANLLSDVTQ